MTKPKACSSGAAPQIVPGGYWTFWYMLSILSGIGGIVIAVTAEMKYDVFIGVISCAWSIAWAAVYWRIKRGTNAT